MNPGVMIAITAAAAAHKAKTQTIDAFRLQGATAPERARPLPDLGLSLTNDALAKLIEAGIIRGVDSRGRLTILGDSIDRVEGYYLDETAFIADRDGTNYTKSELRAVWIGIGLVMAAVGLMIVIVLLRESK